MKTLDAGHLRRAATTILAPIAWGTTYVTVTELLPAGRPVLVAAARVLPAGLALVVLGLLRRGWRPHGREWRPIAVLALLNFAIFLPLLIVAVYRLPGGVAASLGGTQPLLVAVIAHLVTGRPVRRRELAIGVAAALGVALVVIRPDAAADPVGVVAGLAANVAFAGGVVATKHLPPPPDRLAATGWQMVMASFVLIPLAWLVEGPPPALTTTNLVGFAYLSLLATGVAYALWFRGIAALPVNAPPLLGLAAPVTGAVMGWIVLGEDLRPHQLLGFAITIAAISSGALRPAAASMPPTRRGRRGSVGSPCPSIRPS